MKKARNLFLLIFNQLLGCDAALTNSPHSVTCSESSQNGIEMKITMEKDFLEKHFPFRVREFREINGYYQKTVYQDQMEIDFEDQNCKSYKIKNIQPKSCRKSHSLYPIARRSNVIPNKMYILRVQFLILSSPKIKLVFRSRTGSIIILV